MKTLDRKDPRYARMRIEMAARLVRLHLAAGRFEDATFYAKTAASHAQQLIEEGDA